MLELFCVVSQGDQYASPQSINLSKYQHWKHFLGTSSERRSTYVIGNECACVLLHGCTSPYSWDRASGHISTLSMDKPHNTHTLRALCFHGNRQPSQVCGLHWNLKFKCAPCAAIHRQCASMTHTQRDCQFELDLVIKYLIKKRECV